MVTPHSLLVFALAAAGCGAAADDELLIGVDTAADEIVRPSGEATTHPYACTIRMGSGGACSGSLVARNVVLTASHCVSGASRFTVSCPYSGDAAAATGSESMMSPTGRLSFAGGYIRPESGSDVALIRLDRDIRATRYARVRLTNVGTGTRAYVIGRINNGSFTNRLWVSPVINLIWRYGRGEPPYALGANTGLTQPGDSGGPTFDANTDEVIGVVSGGSSRSSIYGIVGAHAQWFTDTVTRWSGSPPEGGTPTPPTGDPPAIEAISPGDGAAIAGDRRVEVSVRARTSTGLASSRIEWLFDTRSWSFECPGSSESYSCAISGDTATYSILVSTGARRYRASVTDRSGRSAQGDWRTLNLGAGASTPSPPTPTPPTPTPPTPGAGPSITGVTPPHGTSLIGNRWTQIEATIAPGASGQAVSTAELRWSYNDMRFACPGRDGSYYCTVDGSTYRWTLNVGTGDRLFAVRAVDRAGQESTSSVSHLIFSDGPANCSESSSRSSAIWTCTRDGQSRDRCMAGRLERQRCAGGCIGRPPGVDDDCSP